MKRLELSEPVPYAGAEGGQLTELVFHAPRGKTLRRIKSTDDAGAQAMVLIFDLTGVPIAILDLLSLDDAILASAIAGELLEKKFAAAAKRGAELGIQVQSASDEGIEPGEIPDSSTLEEVEPATKLQLRD